MINASQVVTLYHLSGLLKKAVLGVSVVAAALAVWPESDGDLPGYAIVAGFRNEECGQHHPTFWITAN